MAMWFGGFNVASKKFTTREVNWKSVAVDTGLRAMGGPIPKAVGLVGKQAVSSLTKGTGRALISKVSVGVAEKSASKVGQFAGSRTAREVGKANSGGIEQGNQMPSITT
ncbi:hypothetical protein [Kocuria massiliensis]|uniref:hypothetical protein n=1 Tax=Kocuria massiliensis TaxID=1926282 RepID=UPI00117A2427|nr:hypothetical protein [Kocuria massiliensis]